MKNDKHGMKFAEKITVENGQRFPTGHSEIVNITTDGDLSLSVNFNFVHVPLLEVRHLEIMIDALEDAFYRMRPDLRKQ